MQLRPHALALAAVAVAPVAFTGEPTSPAQTHDAERRDNRSAETGPITLDRFDDSVPLPVPEVIRPGADGDTLVAPASGDPNFLGFAAGSYYPPAGERIDPQLLATLQAQYADGRPTPATYAFVMFSRRMTPERIADLERLGCRVLKFHPHYTLKVAIPVAAVDAVAALDFVRWIGLAKSWQKVHFHLAGQLSIAPASVPLDVIISVFESDLGPDSTSRSVGSLSTVDPNAGPVRVEDEASLARVWQSNGWQQRALEAAGVQIVDYVDRIPAFRARILPAALESVVALDFVHFVEANVVDRPYHDESTPAILSDYARDAQDGGTNQVGIVGEIDSGIATAHEALNHIYGIGWDDTPESNAWSDDCEHGTHVAGTIFGLPPTARAGYTGNAPGLGSLTTLRIRNVKRFYGAGCTSAGLAHDVYYAHMRGNYTDGSGNISAPPHAINNSWGSTPPGNGTGGFNGWIGSEANAVLLDDEVWDYDQLYVFAAGNDGSAAESIGLPAVAKNCLTVGSVIDYRDATDGDPGQLRSSSSRGPCGDGRWKPNVCAPGRWIRSADAGNLTGYFDNSGTSMAAPHVAGLAAALADHYSFLRYQPHRLASLLMATAMTNNDGTLNTPSDTHLDNFGTGRVNAAKAHFSVSDSTWLNSGFTLPSGSSTFGDFVVAAGTTRIVVCMTYHETSSSTGASQALVNDLDLWIDRDPIDTANNNTGEYSAQQSSIDNTEIRIINSPQTGAWRWKVFSDSTSSSSRVSVTVAFISGDTTPAGTLNVTANDVYVQPSDDVTITATASTPDYMGSFVFLDSTSAGDVLQSASTTLEDGITTDLIDNQHSGRDILLGTIRTGSPRSATWVTRWATEGVKSWCVDARSDNWVDQSDCVNVTVDGTPPTIPTSVTSSTHTVNVWSNDPNVTINWSGATDALSGIDGYGVSWGNSVAGAAPANIKDTEETSPTWIVTWSSSPNWYFGVNTVDNCGNWSASYATGGPFKIDTIVPTLPGVISSSTHTVNVQSCSTTVNVSWAASSDTLSGLAGYLGVWNTTAVFDPTGATNIASGATSASTDIGSSASARYFHLRAKDVAGNYSATQRFGPVYANAASVATYCTGKTNSLGCVPAIGTNGVQPDKSAGNFAVRCTNVLNQKNGLLFWGFVPSAVPFQGGLKCVASPVVRGPNISSGGATSGNSCTGSYAQTWTTAYMNSYGLVPGDTIYCQWWMRDPASPSTTGLSNALQFTICE